MYGLGLFFVVLTRTTMFTYDVARRVSEPHICLQSFKVWYCSVCCELRCLNSKKKKKEEKKNFRAYGRIGIFYLTPFPCTNLQWSVVYFDELSHVDGVKSQIDLILKLKQ